MPLLDRAIQIQFGVKRHSLKQPYALSIGSLSYFDSIWILIKDEQGQLSVGETVPLPGYAKETVDDVLGCMEKIKSESFTLDEIERRANSLKSQFPFTASALKMALESQTWLKSIPRIGKLPLVLPLASSPRRDSILSSLEQGTNLGYKYFKMKIGTDVAQDIKAIQWALSFSEEKFFQISFDANQGYSLKEALEFCSAAEKHHMFNRVRFAEQLLPVDSWSEYSELCSKTSLKVMLDESIYEEDDIRKAKEIGCKAIKLKLFKNFGMDNTLDLAQKAYDLGLEVVLGNGVSTDIGNLYEALIISSRPEIFGPWGECNGFLKLQKPALFSQLQMENGNLIWKEREGETQSLQEQIFSKQKTF